MKTTEIIGSLILLAPPFIGILIALFILAKMLAEDIGWLKVIGIVLSTIIIGSIWILGSIYLISL